MSLIEPVRSARQRSFTRMPVRMRDMAPASTTCKIAVSAPSSAISAQANGRSSGWLARGQSLHDQVVTTPRGATSISSVSVSPVSGSDSHGGTTILPAAVRTPSTRPSRSPAKNRPSKAPWLRR
jgi:hypothetical protein